MRKIAVIPAFEPSPAFTGYAQQLCKQVDCLIVVNDGSGAEYEPIFSKIQQLENVILLSYSENRGKGYALKHAYAYCCAHFDGEDIVVTADCDGQHAICDVLSVCKEAEAYPDSYVLGVRDFTAQNVPARSIAGNTNMLRLLHILYGIQITDSQTGLRACSVSVGEKLASISGNRFEFETGTLIYAKRNGIPVREVGIETIYPEKGEEHISHFRTVRDSCRVVTTLLRYLLPNIFVGVLTVVTDLGIFSLLTYRVFPQKTPGYTLIANIIAKVCASLVSYFVNCKYIFHHKTKRSAGRFYALWTGQLVLSYGNIYLFGHILGGQLVLMKVIGDGVLALLTHSLQCNWVFQRRDSTGFWGRYAKTVRHLARTFSRPYQVDIPKFNEPVVYVCRHLNMHGPLTTLKWLPFQVHPMVIHMYFDRKKTVRHMTEYTLAQRYGKKPMRFNPCAWVMGFIAPPIMQSLQAIPVYRDGNAVSTLKKGIQYLLKDESLIVFPDIAYIADQAHPSDIYSGFLMLGDMYSRRTGVPLSFVPLVIDDKNRTITAGIPVKVRDFRKEREQAAAVLQNAINRINTPSPVC